MSTATRKEGLRCSTSLPGWFSMGAAGHVEALIELGWLDEARDVVEFIAPRKTLDEDLAQGTTSFLRGLIAARDGDFSTALIELE